MGPWGPPDCWPCVSRRNGLGDRDRALSLILPLVRSEGPVASDAYCMCGRIYKDVFISSGFSDHSSREQACYWYDPLLLVPLACYWYR